MLLLINLIVVKVLYVLRFYPQGKNLRSILHFSFTFEYVSNEMYPGLSWPIVVFFRLI